ncbi:kelch repeat-containing protein [Anatilimnocola floriformis]|uniref:kelch repeat-containing protein n=1 Tax=Anatilimnocola floriformis TaxID=2948575 RepID=UPI0020C4F06F|nr:kelch repeat-containing protein [Anatilimnocola floriformis]
MKYCVAGIVFGLLCCSFAVAQEPPSLKDLPTNTWVKLTPLKNTPPSPRLGYEGACVWDSVHQRLIRYGGHNQGGGGEQNSEMWSFDPLTAKWQLHEPNLQPPGICCGQQNVFDPIRGQYIRFPAFSASHGWQWLREVYLNNASIWTFDLPTNRWRMIRPLPTAHPSPLRCASWDREHQVVVLFGGEGNSEGTQVYDPQTNEWIAMKPKQQPEFRSGGSMAYDDQVRQHVLFGSQFNDDKRTWVYDLRENTWRDMQPPEMPPTNKNDAVLTYDAAAGTVLAIIKETVGEDEKAKHQLSTWSYDLAANRWKKLEPASEPDPTGSRARQLMFAPELGVALLENRPSNSSGVAEQQIWAYRTATPDLGKHKSATQFAELKVSTKRDAAHLSWKMVGDRQPARFSIHRGQADRPWKLRWQEVGQVDGNQRAFIDPSVKTGERYFYYLTALLTNSIVDSVSIRVATQPPIADELSVSVLSPQEVQLEWSMPGKESSDIVGYHIERAPVEVLSDDQLKKLKSQTPPLESPSVGMIRRVGPFERLTKEPMLSAKFSDKTIDLNKPTSVEGEPLDQRKVSTEDLDLSGRPYRFGVYAYRVRAVNVLGVEGGASSAVLTIPSAPQFLFSKEDGAKCHLKWQASSEQQLQGYRVYRMDGRYAKDAIPRLTDKPIKELTFTDEEAGKATRRYHVVAVDAIGQEGFPSSPVWFEREWKEFYKPFTGEWHQ